ncbi:3026_t:CDS:2, partial [Racocetra persica]
KAKKGVIFESFPPVLYLQLKRFEYDIARSTVNKINNYFEFPMEIDLEKYLSSEADKTKQQFPMEIDLEEYLSSEADKTKQQFPMEIDLEKDLSSEADKTKQYKYLLYGVLVHNGYCFGGRYFALIKPNKNGKWLKFDDDRVIPVTDKEVLENNYGDGLSSAYVLVYIRESDIKNVLSPMLPEDIPKNL